MKTYEIKLINGCWTVIGYTWLDPFREVIEDPAEIEPPKPDYPLVLIGMHESLDCPDSIVQGIYREVYTMTQVNDHIKLEQGDTFHVAPTTVENYAGKHNIPEQIFTWDGYFHLEWTKGRPEGCTL